MLRVVTYPFIKKLQTMISSANSLRLFIAFISIFACSGLTQAQPQDHILIKAGIGIPEITGIYGGQQIRQLQFIGGLGYLPLENDHLLSVSYNMHYHFMGSGSKSEIKPWYGRMGLCLFREATENWVDKTLFLDTRLGRTMFLTEKLSIELDIGIAVQLAYNRVQIIPTSSWINIQFPVLPAFGTRIVYRFIK